MHFLADSGDKKTDSDGLDDMDMEDTADARFVEIEDGLKAVHCVSPKVIIAVCATVEKESFMVMASYLQLLICLMLLSWI